MTGWRRYWPWLVPIALLVTYELVAAISDQAPTLSELIWRATAVWAPLPYVVMGLLVVLSAHFFFGLWAPDWSTRWLDRLRGKRE